MEFLYVCHFSNGHIKVGRSIYPKSRIASHADRVACVGVELTNHFIVECVSHSAPAEAALIALCADAASRRNKSEWFAGLKFSEVCDWAQQCANVTYDKPVENTKAKAKHNAALDAAVQKAGGITALMYQLNELGHDIKTQATIGQWRHNRVPSDYCPDIEALTGVPCEELRPDVNWAVLRNSKRRGK